MAAETVIDSFRGKYAFLSNFYPCIIDFDDIPYPTLEHAFQAGKTDDPFWRVKMATAATPGTAKRWGRELELRPDWENIKVPFMLGLLRQKFCFTDMRALLLATGTATLIEGNDWHDNFWGTCTCARCGNRGKNTLGMLLTTIRWELVNFNDPDFVNMELRRRLSGNMYRPDPDEEPF